MLIDSLKIMFVGMGTVFLFLVLLVGAVISCAKLIAPFVHHLEGKSGTPSIAAVQPGQEQTVNNRIISIIASSIYTYRMRRGVLYGKEKS